MSSLPNSFTYGSVSSVHSVRDAFASCEYSPYFLHAIVWIPKTADYRSQYYPSSNVQTSDMGNDLPNDEPPLSDPLNPLDSDSVDTERHTMGVPEQNSTMSASPQVFRAAHQMAGVSTPRQPIRAHRGRETTPLLRKAASFTVSSSKTPPAFSDRTNYKSLSHPDDPNTVLQNSTPVPSATIVEHHYNGKSTYGQTVSLIKIYIFKRYLCNIGLQLFNCIAVLLGIGMLSEPLAFAYAGWLWGTVLIIFFGLITCYT